MEISDYENQEKCFSQGSMSKFIESISDFPIEYKDTNNRTSGKISWLGVVILTSAVICGSAIGPVSNMYGNVNPFLKTIWRAELNFIFCIPFALYLIKNTPEAIDMNFITSKSGILSMIISGLFLAGASVTFIASSWLTIASHTYILHSLSGVLIIIYKVCTNQQVHFLEKIGSLAVMAGTVLLLCDPNVHKADGQETSIVGEFLALLCAGFFALYFTSSKRVLTKIPGLIILLLNSLISIACCILVMIIVYGVEAHKILSFDPYEGIFGLFSTQQTGVSLILLPVSLNVAGYTLALNYFQPHIVGNAFVVEPFIGQLIGCLAHQDQLPGVLTFIGGLVILPAIIVVAKGSQECVKSK